MIIDLKPFIFILILFASWSLLYCAAPKETDLSDAQIIQLQKQELYQITDIQAEELSVIKQVLINRIKALKDRNTKLQEELKAKNENANMTLDEKDQLIQKLKMQLDSTRTSLMKANSKISECVEMLNNRSIGISNPESQDRFASFMQGVGVTKYEESVPFVPGSATVGPKGKKILQDFAKHLEGLGDGYVIQVIGNTDSVPIHGELMKKYPTNWELSVARSVAVVKYLVDDEKVNPKNIIVGGKAEYNPVVPNSTSKNRSENRRVDLLLSH
jgi:chemotaxis protein MotB